MHLPFLSRFTSQPAPTSVEKAANPPLAVGVMPGVSTSLRDDVLGQPHDSNYDLLYGIYNLNTDVSGSIDRWIGVVTGNGWQIVPMDPEREIDAALQTDIDRLTTWLKNPNPSKRFDLLSQEMIMHLGIAGDYYWHKILDSDGHPVELHPIHPATVKVVCDEYGVVIGYIQRLNGKVVARFEAEEVLHFRLPNPTNDLYGQSPLERAQEEISQDLKAVRANKSLLDNGMSPSAILMLSEEVTDEGLVKRINNQIKQSHAGTSKWHKLMALAGVKDLKPWGHTLKDMQFSELRALATSKIATAYGVPKLYLNQKDAADYATSEVLERDLYNNKGKMLQNLTGELITEELIHAVNPELRFVWNPPQFGNPDALRRDAIELRKTSQSAIDDNELRGLFSLAARDEDENPSNTTTDEEERVEEEAEEDQEEMKSVAKALSATELEDLADAREAEMETLAQAIEPALVAFFTSQEQRYLDRLSKRALKSTVTKDVDDWVDEGAEHEDELLHALMFGLLVASLNAGINAAELQISMTLSLEQANPIVQSYLKNQAAEHVKGINQTTRDRLRRALSEGVANRETTAELADRVSTVFTDAKGYRAQLIARVETAQAYAHANAQALEATGVVLAYSWITARDERVCPQCQPMHGQQRKPGKTYKGGVMPTSIHLQCRCSEVGIVDEEDVELS